VTKAADFEALRAEELRAAELDAEHLFNIVLEREFIRSGRTELEVSDDIKALARELLGVTRYWHKRIVRSGANTLEPYSSNPPNLVIEPDDIVFLDFGPVFVDWEADFGRSYVLGDDPRKHALVADLDSIWHAGKQWFDEHENATGEQLFDVVSQLAQQAGWEYGPDMAGHLIGEFPHERVDDDRVASYITRGNDRVMRGLDPHGRTLHWILEIHLVDRERGFGGFFEQLLTVD
jgi:Xaa-Pro aminopeptidase